MRIQPTDMETNNQPATRNTTTGVTPKYGDFYWAKMPSCHPQTWECHQKTKDLTILQPVLTRANWTRPRKGTQFCCENELTKI